MTVVLQEAEGLVHGLNTAQFNWSPSPGAWSILQCLDHLNTINHMWLNVLGGAVQRGRSAGALHPGPYSYGLLGRFFLRLIQPGSKRKFKAPAAFQPKANLNPEAVLSKWLESHDKMTKLLGEANGLDLRGIKVGLPALEWVKLNLGIGFWVMTAHDRRHLQQMREVRNNPGFPGQ
ncbi:MAG: DinB family protein [Acidobacteriia bacterium]|nr:DinB family protein [Terriglobia bacterium]